MKTLRHVLNKIEDPNLSDAEGSRLLKIIFTELFKSLNVDLDKEIFKNNSKKKNFANKVDKKAER